MSFYGGQFVYRVNTDGLGPKLLIEVFNERGWREFKEDKDLSEHWNLWWRTTGFPVSMDNPLKTWQFTNHIPRGSTICRKDTLARTIKCFKTIYGDIYDIIPQGFHLPLEYKKLVGECIKKGEKKYWICKPVGASQGRGITIFKNLKNLCYDTSAIVQKYIHNPLLIAGYKFDLRLYVCVPSFHPLTIYMYKEGLVRFATVKFSLDDLKNPFCHLTNSSLNRQGPGYKEMKDEIGAGCKWSLKQLRKHLHQSGIRDWLLWQRISIMIILTVLSQTESIQETMNSFEFYGFDVLVDEDLKPWLLEVNLSPALGTDCDVDPAIKKPMLHDLFDLVGLPICNKNLLYTFLGERRLLTYDMEPVDENQIELHRSKIRVVQPVRCDVKLSKHLQHSESLPNIRLVKEVERSVKKSNSMTNNKIMSKSKDKPVKKRQQIGISAKKMCSENRYSKSNILQYKLRNKLQTNYMIWGNGKDWRRSVTSKGDWSRIYPISHVDVQDDWSFSKEDFQIKTVVSTLIKLEKISSRIYKNNPSLNDDELNHLLINKCDLNIPVWLPNN